jgi:hypothetical protein
LGREYWPCGRGGGPRCGRLGAHLAWRAVAGRYLRGEAAVIDQAAPGTLAVKIQHRAGQRGTRGCKVQAAGADGLGGGTGGGLEGRTQQAASLGALGRHHLCSGGRGARAVGSWAPPGRGKAGSRAGARGGSLGHLARRSKLPRPAAVGQDARKPRGAGEAAGQGGARQGAHHRPRGERAAICEAHGRVRGAPGRGHRFNPRVQAEAVGREAGRQLVGDRADAPGRQAVLACSAGVEGGSREGRQFWPAAAGGRVVCGALPPVPTAPAHPLPACASQTSAAGC